MNRYYKITTLLLVLALVSCYKDEPMTEPGQQGATALKRCLRNGDDVKMIVDPERLHKITPQRAELIAVNAASAFSANANTRTYAAKAVSAVEPILSSAASGIAPSSAGTRAASTTADTLMYAVNFANEEGFALVSFDDRDGDIIMYSENGNFDMAEVMAADDIMKFHVDMVMAYQQDKLNRIREAKAAGIEYVGELQMDTVAVEEFDMPTDLAENPYEQVATRAGMPGSGLPGGGSGRPGMPGMPGEGCVPSDFDIIGWEGNQNVIDLIERRYGSNTRCYGQAVAPPKIDFNPLGLPGIDAPPCPYPPYCDPPIVDYNGYYRYYGATLYASRTTAKASMNKLVGPYQKTFWSSDEPLNMYAFNNAAKLRNTTLVNCPLAMAQLMVHHEYPLGYSSNFPYDANTPYHHVSINMPEIKKLLNNKNISASPYKIDAARFVKEVSVRLDYYIKTFEDEDSPHLFYDPFSLRRTLESFGFSFGKNLQEYTGNFNMITESLDDKLIVLVIGLVDKNNSQGFVWNIDGYNLKKKIIDDWYLIFDEFGNYNKTKKESYEFVEKYIHANMSCGSQRKYSIWLKKDAYEFAEVNYAFIKMVPGIKPNIP